MQRVLLIVNRKALCVKEHRYVVVFGPRRSSARPCFGSSCWAKELGFIQLVMPSKELGTACHALEKTSAKLSSINDSKK